MHSESILIVDDEQRVLASLTRTLLEEDYDSARTALNGLDALEIVKSTPNLALIISDHHMPGMNGIDFLVQARKISPHTTRILLSGAADLEMAVDAVNRGSIFRFLIKPCPTDVLLTAVRDGLKQYQLVTGERDLLSKTLNGSIKLMVDLLGVFNPQIFSQASRLRNLARELSSALQIEDQSWEIELAALLSQIGAVALPKEIVEKWQNNQKLDEAETEMIRSIPQMGRRLIKNIPRLDRIADAVGYQDCVFTGRLMLDQPVGDKIPLAARILKIVADYDRFLQKTGSERTAFQMLSQQEKQYDPLILDVFQNKVLRTTSMQVNVKPGEKQIFVQTVKIGMVVTRDVIDKNGMIVVTRGSAITEVLKLQLDNYVRSQAISDIVYIDSNLM